MKTSRSSRFEALSEQVRSGKGAAERPAKRRRPVLGHREEELGAVVSGKRRQVRVFEHEPARIRPWSGHNRDYEALDPERCADLIDGFKRAGQQFPVIVRAVREDDPGRAHHDFEYICGARRHWTASYLGIDLVVEVRELDDKTAFLLQDIENRDRQDVCDLERARDYMRALPLFFEGNISRMAKELEYDRGNFSRLLALASLPEEIVRAYGDERELVTHHGTLYGRWLKEPGSRKRLLAAARALHGKHLGGKAVIKALRAAVSRTDAAGPAGEGVHGAIAWRRSGKDYRLTIPAGQLEDPTARATLRRDFEALLEQLRPPLTNPAASAPDAAPAHRVPQGGSGRRVAETADG